MTEVVQALAFGVAVAFMFVGLVGILLPIMPGTLLIWLSALAYAIVDRFETVGVPTFVVITLIALVSGTADIWMSILGAKTGGASFRSMILGVVGAIVGFVVLTPLIPVVGSLFGGVIGYALGVLLGQYHKHRDWRIAARASLGGLAGWGIATAVQLGGGVLIMAIFIWRALAQ
jgi:hypothetical protein